MKKRVHLKFVVLFVGVLLLMAVFQMLSCAKAELATRSANAPPPPPMSAPAETSAGDKRAGMAGDATVEIPAQQANKPPVQENMALRGRKLIREGTVKLKVKDVEETRARLEKMVQAVGGFIANVEFQGYSGSRTLNLTLRLPAEGFLSFLVKIHRLGFVEEENTSVTDITDQYVDLDRRIQTNQKMAARLEQLIQEHSYQFKDLLEVEKELSRLQLETESLQGSMRGLDDRIALSTLHVHMYQEVQQQVVPPDSTFAPLVGAIENAGPTFRRSVRALSAFIGFFIRAIVALIPWLIFLGVIAVVVIVIVRRVWRKKN
jgi:VIT1/CCC1 family predicted Fe2+/Mn2+ transporter